MTAISDQRADQPTNLIGRSRSVRARRRPLPATALPQIAQPGQQIELTISGIARHRLMIPPAATAPAPMYSR